MLEALRHAAPFDSVFIHGAGETGHLWRGILDWLSGPRRAAAINLPGHPAGEITCRSVKEYAESVHRFISEEGMARPVVCGHSMGGAIALDLALNHPEEIGGLVLVGTGAKLGVLPEILEGLSDQPLKVIEKTITPMSFYDVNLDVAREARAALSLTNPSVFLNDYRACTGFDVMERLHQISARTLIICGENDRMTPPKWSHYLNANIPSSTLFFIRESGHMVPLEKPELCGKLIQDFLTELSR
jgi:pimeloyl-ACP methyl ester carboxylesterase